MESYALLVHAWAFLDVLPQSKIKLHRLIDYLKLPLDVHVSVWPSNKLATCAGCAPPLTWVGSSNPHDPKRWMSVCVDCIVTECVAVFCLLAMCIGCMFHCDATTSIWTGKENLNEKSSVHQKGKQQHYL